MSAYRKIYVWLASLQVQCQIHTDVSGIVFISSDHDMRTYVEALTLTRAPQLHIKLSLVRFSCLSQTKRILFQEMITRLFLYLFKVGDTYYLAFSKHSCAHFV